MLSIQFANVLEQIRGGEGWSRGFACTYIYMGRLIGFGGEFGGEGWRCRERHLHKLEGIEGYR